ncbi:hypothetical protein ACHAXT_011675 [Thalassiosira profunda]
MAHHYVCPIPRGLARNASSFTSLNVGNDWYPNGGKEAAGDVGELIAKHRYLKTLVFDDIYLAAREDMEELLRGVAKNRSVKELMFSACNGFWGSVVEILTPFLEENTELTKLAIGDCHSMKHDELRALASVLQKCTNSSLREIVLFRQRINDDLSAELIASFSSLPQLTKLDLSENGVGIKGCEALASLLRNPASQLQEIKLGSNRGSNHIDDKGATVLAESLVGNTTLTSLDFGGDDVLKNLMAKETNTQEEISAIEQLEKRQAKKPRSN